MTTSRKRLVYDSETDSNSTMDEDYDYCPEKKYSKTTNSKRSVLSSSVNIQRDRQPTRVPRVFNRNAVLARENRIKKKEYVANLENDIGRLQDRNTKLNSIMENQSLVIADLRKELNYVKSVLANSDDLAKLLSSLQRNAGMSVSSSLLGKSAPIKSDYISKTETCKEKHPWEENVSTSYPSYPTPDSPDDNDILNLDIPFTDSELLNLPLSDDFPLLDFPDSPREYIEPSAMHLSEHNYTANKYKDDEGTKNIGICLHVSNQRVSLEFCSTCNSNAVSNWIRNN